MGPRGVHAGVARPPPGTAHPAGPGGRLRVRHAGGPGGGGARRGGRCAGGAHGGGALGRVHAGLAGRRPAARAAGQGRPHRWLPVLRRPHVRRLLRGARRRRALPRLGPLRRSGDRRPRRRGEGRGGGRRDPRARGRGQGRGPAGGRTALRRPGRGRVPRVHTRTGRGQGRGPAGGRTALRRPGRGRVPRVHTRTGRSSPGPSTSTSPTSTRATGRWSPGPPNWPGSWPRRPTRPDGHTAGPGQDRPGWTARTSPSTGSRIRCSR